MSTTNLEHTAARPLTDETFAAEIEQSRGIALVDFGADWCPPCRMMAPVIERIASEYAGRATVGTLDVDANPRVQARYDVRSLPTFLLFRDGEVVDRIVGAVPKSRLTERLDALLREGRSGSSSSNG
jgi:thioredoxin 1